MSAGDKEDEEIDVETVLAAENWRRVALDLCNVLRRTECRLTDLAVCWEERPLTGATEEPARESSASDRR